MPDIQTFVNRMIYWCATASLGYDQNHRWDIRDGGAADCSSLVIFAAREAGFNTGDASYTGNMREAFTKNGWTVLPPNTPKQAGDILLNDVHHVAVYLGNNKIAQASIDERGRASGGREGDQSNETNIRNYYDYPWNCVLRYNGINTTPAPSDTTRIHVDVDGYFGHQLAKALQTIQGTNPDGIISGQYRNKWTTPISAVQFGTGGSDLIASMSAELGTTNDPRYIGPTWVGRILVRYNGTTGNGVIDRPSDAIRKMQERINATGKW